MKQKKSNKKITLPETNVSSSKVVPVKTDAELIWEEIKDLSIEMFALPGQTVALHCKPFLVEPSKLYLEAKSTATLPSLEVAIGSKYVVSLVDRFIVVSRAPAKLTANK